MAGEAVIGALRVVLDADNDNFGPAMDQAKTKVAQLETSFEQLSVKLQDVGKKIAVIGAGISATFTATLSAISVGATRTAADFETAMKRVERALGAITPDQLQALEKQAQTMGAAVGRNASDAAAGIEKLADSGMSASEIMDGAFAASLKLAAIGNTELAPAAQLTTGVMQAFGKTAAELGPVVDRITGALQTGHGGFEAYNSAVATAGDQAARSGVSFEDFNTVVGGIGAVLNKGSEAGGSFKSFLAGIAAPTDAAKKEMKDLGVSFTDAQHNLKPLSDIAAILQKTMTGLSDQARTKVFTDMFGGDGISTAITLMTLGKKGYLDLQATIGQASGDKAAAAAQDGYAAAVNRLSAAYQNLKIAIGQSGLLDFATRFVDLLARVVTKLAEFGPAAGKVGTAFGVIAAAAGPVLAVVGGGLYFAFGVWLRNLGPITSGIGKLGWAISAVLEPIGTLVSAVLRIGLALAGSAGLSGLGGVFLKLAGPIGLAVTAVLLFKNAVVPALEKVWDMASSTLGAPLAALIAKVGSLFTSLSGGPIGTAVSFIGSAVSTIMDVLEVLTAYVVEMFGGAFVQAAGIVIGALSTLVSMVQDVVTVVGDLLGGDFAGAWSAAQRFVGDAVQGIVDIIKGLFPGAAAAIQTFYESAKALLVDGVGGVFTWVGGMADWLVTAIGGSFPQIIAIAKSVYEGIKAWLVDALGPVGEWIASWAGGVVARFNAMKVAVGLGAAQAAPKAPPAPTAPSVPKPTKHAVTNNYMPKNDDDDGKDKDKKEKHGPTAEDLRLQKEIEADQLRGDLAEAQALQDKLDLNKQIEAYQRTGLGLTDATTRANRDLKDIQAARLQSQARAIADEQRSTDITIAQLGHHYQTEVSLQRQAELEKLILFYKGQGLTAAHALSAATAEQARLEAGRETARQKWVADDADVQALKMAQLRGDSDEQIRLLQRVIDVKKRADEIEAAGNGKVSHDDAVGQANREADQQHQAELTGKFRDIFKGGFKAAMDGDIGSWFTSWWKDRVQKGMEQAINALSDLVAKLFSNLSSGNNGSSSGGLFGSLGSVIGSLFGKGGTSATAIDTSSWGTSLPTSMSLGSIAIPDLPKFATGGSFKVGGRSGIDQNLVSMHLSKGEMVDIRRPGNDTGPSGSTTVNQTIQYSGAVDIADKTFVVRMAEAARQAAMSGVADQRRRSGNG